MQVLERWILAALRNRTLFSLAEFNMREDLTTRCDSSSNRPNADSHLDRRHRAARPF